MGSQRSAQLSTWRKIVAKSHSPDDSVSDHITFIRERFRELDSDGFNWSKEAILGMFFQVGLPSGFPISFEHVNELVDKKNHLTRSPDLMNASVVEEIIKTEEKRMKPDHSSLMKLPTEILEDISRHVQLLDLPIRNKSWIDSLRQREWAPGLPLYGNDSESSDSEPDDSDSLSSRDSESSNSHRCRCYDCSDPLTCLCQCHRSQSSRPFQDSRPQQFHPDTKPLENLLSLAAINRKMHGICAALVWKTLRIESWKNRPNSFAKTLLLRHGHLVRSIIFETCEPESLANVASHLPSLESFEWCQYSQSNLRTTDVVGNCLMSLKSLTRLRLDHVPIDSTWYLHSWQPRLTTLELVFCKNLTPILAQKLIQPLAPSLSRLILWSEIIEDLDKEEIASQLDFYDLPLLTELFIDRDMNSFRNCKKIHHLGFRDPYKYACTLILQLLSQSNWPLMKQVELYFLQFKALKPGSNHQLKIRKLCRGSGIEFFWVLFEHFNEL